MNKKETTIKEIGDLYIRSRKEEERLGDEIERLKKKLEDNKEKQNRLIILAHLLSNGKKTPNTGI